MACLDHRSEVGFRTLFWCGVGGWACVVCLAVPGVSIVTFLCFYWAFFPAPIRRFVGLGNVLKGMGLSALILVPLLLFLGSRLYAWMTQ